MVLPAYLPSQSPKSTVLPADLRYYIVRKSDNGSSYVPLVPADQLPFRLHGVPTELDKEQAKEEEWHLVTRTSESKFTLAVQAPAQQLLSPPPSPNTGYRAPDHDVKTESRNRTPAPETDLARIPYNLVNGMSTSASAALGIGLDLRKAAAQLSPTNHKFPHTYNGPRQIHSPKVGPSGVVPDPNKKEFCTHWIKTGECDYIAQGCKYKHEMPPVQKLRELGLGSTIPLWYKQKQSGPTWLQRKEADGDVDYRFSRPRQQDRRDRGIFGELSKDPPREDTDQYLIGSIPQEIPNLIDLDDPPTPAPTRCESVISTTTDTASTHSSEASSSVNQNPPPARRNAVLSHLKPAHCPRIEKLSAPLKEANRIVESRCDTGVSNVHGDIFTETKPKPDNKKRPGKKTGLAGSKHAAQVSEVTTPASAAPTPKQTKSKKNKGGDAKSQKQLTTKKLPPQLPSPSAKRQGESHMAKIERQQLGTAKGGNASNA